jgi:hypothetical protein
MPIVFIRKEATGEVRKHLDKFPWDGDYMWADGNYSCDCNRHLFFERAAGAEPPWDEGKCGDEAYAVRIEDDNGKELYRDDRWQS